MALGKNIIEIILDLYKENFFNKINSVLDMGDQDVFLKYEEIKHVFSSFENVKYKTVGFWGTFGRTEKQRHLLSKLDNLFERFIPLKKRYIVFGIAEKHTKPNKT